MSKALEALKELEGIEYVADVLKVNHKIGSRDIANQEIKEMVDRLNYRIPTIKQALIKSEKEHKALEIIKEKECDMRWFKYCIKVNSEVETYNNGLPEYYEKLTQEEFNLLIEVLE